MKQPLAELPLAELEERAVSLHADYRRAEKDMGIHYHPVDQARWRRIQKFPSLSEILHERKTRLNRDFIFGKESAARFLAINALLQTSLVQARRDVRRLLRPRRKGEPAALRFSDQELEVRVEPYTEHEGGIAEVLEATLQHSSCVIQSGLRLLHNPAGLHELDWHECDGLDRHHALHGHRIGYAMHALYSYSYWSLPDILEIQHVWCDLIFTWQRHRKLPNQTNCDQL